MIYSFFSWVAYLICDIMAGLTYRAHERQGPKKSTTTRENRVRLPIDHSIIVLSCTSLNERVLRVSNGLEVSLRNKSNKPLNLFDKNIKITHFSKFTTTKICYLILNLLVDYDDVMEIDFNPWAEFKIKMRSKRKRVF